MSLKKKILVETRRILTPYSNWTQRHLALDGKGESVPPTDPSAVCWCLEGAINLAVWRVSEDGKGFASTLAYLDKLIDDKWPGKTQMDRWKSPWDGLTDWNDAEERHHSEVLQLLDEGISNV